jgi:hypothetical protein
MSKIKTGVDSVKKAGKVLKKFRDLKNKKNDPLETFLKKNKKPLRPKEDYNLGFSVIAAGVMTPSMVADLKNAKRTGRYTTVKRKFMKKIDPKSPAEIKAADKLFHSFVGDKKPKLKKGGMKKNISSVKYKTKPKRKK